MHAYHCDSFVLPLPETHRFPMRKYARLREQVEACLPEVTLCVPEGATDAQLMTAHDPTYVTRVVDGLLSPSEVRRIGFPWSDALVERSRRSVGGSLAAARAALEEGVAVNLAGGTHHAGPTFGQGYCVFNDFAVTARVLLDEGAVDQVLIIDLDVHQGNGTAQIFTDDPRVFTVSVHGEKNFPFKKSPSDLDIGLPDQTDTESYLDAVDACLDAALQRCHPNLVLYLAGADPYVNDKLGRLSVSREGLRERDQRVLSLGIPTAIAMGGGYAPDIDEIADIHLGSVETAYARWRGDLKLLALP